MSASFNGSIKGVVLAAVLSLGMVGCGGGDDNPNGPSGTGGNDDPNGPSGTGGNHFNPSITYGSFTDVRDGKSYRTVVMPDGKTWMAENLNHQTGDSWCYGDDPSNCDTYGRLYTWEAAMNGALSSNLNPSGVQGICPAGWHLPSDAEWTELVNFVNTSTTSTNNVGTKLKSTSGWYNNGNGTDDFGFSALPGGLLWSDGDFNSADDHGYWWSATEFDATNARFLRMDYNDVNVLSYWYNKAEAFSVRCVVD